MERPLDMRVYVDLIKNDITHVLNADIPLVPKLFAKQGGTEIRRLFSCGSEKVRLEHAVYKKIEDESLLHDGVPIRLITYRILSK